MNINELNRIETLNIAEAVKDEKYGSGTFKEIVDKVYDGVIIPLTDNSGMIVGISHNSNVTTLLEDNIEQRKFEIRYSGIDVMSWILKALQLKATNKVIAEVVETPEIIKVVLDNGMEEIIEEHHPRVVTCGEELPNELTVDVDDLDGDYSLPAVKKYLRDSYDHYLSGFDEDPDIEYLDETNQIHITNISWGRKR